VNDAFFARLREEFSSRRKYLVGVSGGRDSVALLDCLLKAGIGRLVVCHLNHGLRGRASAGDAAFVKGLAIRSGLPFAGDKVAVGKLAKTEGLSIETAARRARRSFFAATARAQRCDRIILAHHADDQAETVLMNLARGSGLGGLAGMRRESEQEIDGCKLTLLRPLLSVWRAEIDAWVAKRGLKFREDASNAEAETGVRNRVRLQLLPEMNKVFGRDVAASLLRLSRLADGNEALINEAFADALTMASGERLPVRKLSQCSAPLRQRVLLDWLRERGIGNCGVAEVQRVEALLETPLGTGPAKVNLPGGWHARRQSGGIFLQAPVERIGEITEP